MSDVVRNINEIAANSFTGKYMKASYRDLIYPKPEETRTAEEVIQHIKDGLNELGA